MTGPIKPTLRIAVFLSLSLVVSLFLLMIGLSMALGMILGEDRFTFGNEFFIQCIAFTAAVAEAVLICRFVDFKSSAAETLLSLRPAGLTELFIAVTAAIALTFPLSEIDNCLQAFFPPGEMERQMMLAAYNPPTAVEKVFVVLSLVGAAPVGEELLYRGVMFSWIRETASRPRTAIAVTALFFGASHVLVPRSIILIVAVGLILGWLVLRTGSIFSSIAAHAAFNGFPLFAYWSGVQIAGYNSGGKQLEHVPLPLWAGGLIILGLCLVILEIVLRSRKKKGNDGR
jgi:membrane protease YdiL (CAAX protease family)